MYIKELKLSSMLVKIASDGNYLVDDETTAGIRVLQTTKNVLQAKFFTVAEAYHDTYNALSEDDKQELIKEYAKKDPYYTLSRHVAENYRVISETSISWGYSGDIEPERKLFKQIGLEIPTKVIIQSIDTPEAEGE
jgi:hypothetical protein